MDLLERLEQQRRDHIQAQRDELNALRQQLIEERRNAIESEQDYRDVRQVNEQLKAQLVALAAERDAALALLALCTHYEIPNWICVQIVSILTEKNERERDGVS